MAQLIVRNLEDEVRDKLKQLAAAHGRSMEEEVRAILRSVVLQVDLRPDDGLGTRIAKRFREHGVEPGEIVEHKGQAPRPADLRP
ncbi:MAG: Arc family DNA-binding protein [Planctomycetota bacterium]